MRNCPQLFQQRFQFVVTEKQRIPATQEHVTNLRMPSHVIELPVEFRMEILTGRIADQT